MLDRIDDSIKSHGLENPAVDPAVRVPFLAAGDALTLDLRRSARS
jgi:hypothetical protein